MNKQVLQFIIEENNPTGIIECSVDDWFGISYKIPRNKLREASGLDYINNTGVYILFGEDENTAEKIIFRPEHSGWLLPPAAGGGVSAGSRTPPAEAGH